MNFARSSISNRFERFGGEGAIGVGNAVEPGLAEPVPFGLGRNASVDAAELQAPQTGKLTHDLGVPSCPVREELLAREAGLSADETDASDHGALTVRAAAGTIPA